MSRTRPDGRPPTAADERDLYPRKTPPQGHPAAALAIPHEVRDERGTGVVEGEELRLVRERRPTPQRVAHLETRVDAVVKDIGEIKGDVHGIRDMLQRDLEERRLDRQLRSQTETNQVSLERTRLTSRAKIIVSIVGAIGAVIGGGIALLIKAVS